MPQMGHLPGWSDTTCGCIGHVYFVAVEVDGEILVDGTLVGVHRGADGAAFSPGTVAGVSCFMPAMS